MATVIETRGAQRLALHLEARIDERAKLAKRDVAVSYGKLLGTNGIPNEEAEELFWQTTFQGFYHLEQGVSLLAESLQDPRELPLSGAATATRLFSEFVERKLPALVHEGTQEQQFLHCLKIAPLFSQLDMTNPYVPREVPELTNRLIFRWDPERQVLILTETFLLESLVANPSKNHDSLEKQCRLQRQKRLFELTELIDDNEGIFSENTLRLAVAAANSRVVIAVANPFDPRRKDRIPFLSGVNYLNDFREHFTQLPKGYIHAVKIIAEAIQNGSTTVREGLIQYMVGKTWVTKNGSSVNFAPFFRQVLRVLKDTNHPQYQEAQNTMEELLDASMEIDPNESGNLLLGIVSYYPEYTKEEQVAVLKHYLRYLRHHGYLIDTSLLSDDEVYKVVKGKLKIVYGTNDGDPITVAGKVIGKFYETPPQEELAQATTDSTSQRLPRAEEFLQSGILLDLSKGTSTGEQEGWFVREPEEEEKLLELETLYTERRRRYTPKATPEGEIPSAMISEQPTQLEAADEINKILDTIFGKEPTDEEVQKYREERIKKWKDVFGEDAKRGDSSFVRKGNMFRPTLRRIRKADESVTPRVELYKQPVRVIDGVSASDIRAKIVSDAGEIDLFLDKFGEAGGIISDLYIEGLLSENRVEQINYFFVSLCHELLVKEPSREFAKRLKEARTFAMGQLEPHNEARKRQLQEAREAGRESTVIEMSYGGEGLLPTVAEVTEDAIVERLQAGEKFVPVHFFLTDEQRQNIKRRKGKVIAADEGRLVYLPAKLTKENKLPQASDAAMEHAKKLFARVPEYSQLFWLTPSGLLAKTDPLTMTFASYPKPKDNALDK